MMLLWCRLTGVKIWRIPFSSHRLCARLSNKQATWASPWSLGRSTTSRFGVLPSRPFKKSRKLPYPIYVFSNATRTTSRLSWPLWRFRFPTVDTENPSHIVRPLKRPADAQSFMTPRPKKKVGSRAPLEIVLSNTITPAAATKTQHQLWYSQSGRFWCCHGKLCTRKASQRRHKLCMGPWSGLLEWVVTRASKAYPCHAGSWALRPTVTDPQTASTAMAQCTSCERCSLAWPTQKLQGQIVFAAAGYVSVAIEAALTLQVLDPSVLWARRLRNQQGYGLGGWGVDSGDCL